jgi:hypothetical protein
VRRTKSKSESLIRTKRKTILFNTLENQALDKYLKKYNVENQSKFMREAIMKTVLKKFSDDYPTLWDQPGVAPQLRLF